jgi:DNA-binding phage protein
MSETAKASSLTREALYKAGHDSITISRVCAALSMRLTVQPVLA